MMKENRKKKNRMQILAIKSERLIPGYNHDVMHKKIQKLVRI